MKSSAIKHADAPALTQWYREAASAHMSASADGDYKKANRQYDIIAEVYRELRNRGLDAQRELLILLSDPDPGVRAWAGAHALEFAPNEGEPVLMELTGDPRFSADMTLREWRAGRLRFP